MASVMANQSFERTASGPYRSPSAQSHIGGWINLPAAAVMLGLTFVNSQAESLLPLQTVLCADLDGDSRADSAIITFTPDRHGIFDYFRVAVGPDSIVQFGQGLHGTARVVDLDTTDGLREIAVPAWGPSDDDAVHFVRYSQGRVRILGSIPGSIDYLRVDGSGVVRTTCRGSILHTWWYPCAYRVFEESGVLGEVHQAFKVMNARVRLKRDLPLFPSPEHRRVTTVIRRGEWATIEVTDDQEWCRIRSPAGVTGWFWVTGGGVVIGTSTIPGQEVFDQLVIVD